MQWYIGDTLGKTVHAFYTRAVLGAFHFVQLLGGV